MLVLPGDPFLSSVQISKMENLFFVVFFPLNNPEVRVGARDLSLESASTGSLKGMTVGFERRLGLSG